MSFESSFKARDLTRNFNFKIANFMKHAGNAWNMPGGISSPQFSFPGLENENYEGYIFVEDDRGEFHNAIYGDARFGVKLSASSIVSGHLPSVRSVISVSSQNATGYTNSVVPEHMYYGKISEDTKTYVAFVRESWNDLKKLLQDEDELVVSVTLILSYAYENAEADWKQANSVADGYSFGRKRNTPTVPPYVETLALRSNTDVTIECCGQQFAAHATVLKAVSRVFERMLENEMKEAVTRQIVIVDVQPDTIQRMMEYIYKGELFSEEEKPTDEALVQLLHCGEKYELANLKKQVLTEIVSRLSVHSALKFFKALKTYNADEATLAEVLEYCRRNLFDFPKEAEFKDFWLELIGY